MGKYYILSGMNKANDYNFYDSIAKIFKKEISNFQEIVYISAFPNDFNRNKKLSKSEKFLNIGINFKKSTVVDYSYNIEQVNELIRKSELICLYGGDPYKQMQFIYDYKIKDLLKNKTLITLSAGSINISQEAICTEDDDFDYTFKYKGLGLIEYSIEPHFNINNKKVLEKLKEYSKKIDIYALEDEAFIIENNNNKILHGNIYKIAKGNFLKVN